MKICIIGNSHVAPLKTAWDSVNLQYDSINIDFFAHQGQGLRDLVVQDNKLISMNMKLTNALLVTSNGKKEIIPAEYDVILLFGLNAKALFERDLSAYSKQVVIDTANDCVREALSFEVLEKIRSFSNCPVYIGHNPFRTSKNINYNGSSFGYKEGIKMLNDLIYEKYNSIMICQPEQTIVNGKFTDPSFNKNAARLNVNNILSSEGMFYEDPAHMNSDFGLIWLEHFFNHVVIN